MSQPQVKNESEVWFRVSKFRIQGSGFGVQDSGLKVQGAGSGFGCNKEERTDRPCRV